MDGSIINIGTRTSAEVNAPAMEPVGDVVATAAADKAKGKFTTEGIVATSVNVMSAGVTLVNLPVGGESVSTAYASVTRMWLPLPYLKKRG